MLASVGLVENMLASVGLVEMSIENMLASVGLEEMSIENKCSLEHNFLMRIKSELHAFNFLMLPAISVLTG
jgi:hypothetical protein